MAFFRLIIPTYGDAPYLDEAVQSVKNQTIANDILLIVVHDNSVICPSVDQTDRDINVYTNEHRWNGGSRNLGMRYGLGSSYTLFLDHDDTIPNPEVLEHLKNFIIENDFPDMVRLPYTKLYVEDGRRVTKHLAKEQTLSDVIKSVRVAPWTKCVKSTCIANFPENTVFEDVCQHLMTCDICETYAAFSEPVVEWRIWPGQTSKRKDKKWESSKWRFIADLKDLEPKKKEVRVQRNYKVKAAIEGLIHDFEGGK